MPNSWNEILTARQGSVVINDKKVFPANMYVITSVSDATIIDILDQDELDVLTDYIVDPTATIPRGSIITPRDIKKPFTQVRLSAGAVCVTLGAATPDPVLAIIPKSALYN